MITYVYFITMTFSNGTLRSWNTFRLMTNQASFTETTSYAIIFITIFFGNSNICRCVCISTAQNTFIATLLINFILWICTSWFIVTWSGCRSCRGRCFPYLKVLAFILQIFLIIDISHQISFECCTLCIDT